MRIFNEHYGEPANLIHSGVRLAYGNLLVSVSVTTTITATALDDGSSGTTDLEVIISK